MSVLTLLYILFYIPKSFIQKHPHYMHEFEAGATKLIKTWLISVLEIWKIGIWKRAISAITDKWTMCHGSREEEIANS